MRFLVLLVAGFLFVSSLEAWAGYWLAGRWFIGSRFATVSLGTVKNWLDRGIIRPSTQTAKIFVNRYGKIILLTLGLSQVIPEVERLQSASEYCYAPASRTVSAGWTSWGSLSVHHSGNAPENFYTVSYSRSCSSGSANIPAVQIRAWLRPRNSNRYQWVEYAYVPAPGTYQIGQCSVTFSLRNVGGVCPSDVSQPPSQVDWNQRRRVPVRVFPNPSDFVRPDVIEGDPSLKWLRDEYQRIVRDQSIPLIPSDALRGVELPGIDWKIPPEEAIDSAAESSRDTPRPSTDAPPDAPPRDRPRDEDRPRDDSLSVPGLDTFLPEVERRSFPSELLNTIVQSHPLLRVLQSVSLDPGSGGSCVIGSRPFQFDFCSFGWVLNLMGSVIVFVAFLTGLFWVGRSD